jgi:hypothetical protein
LRVCMPTSGVEYMYKVHRSLTAAYLERSTSWRTRSSFRYEQYERETAGIGVKCAWLSIFWLMLLFLFRADTMAGMITNPATRTVRIGKHKNVEFTVNRVKRSNVGDGGVVQPFVRSVPDAKPGSLREEIIGFIAVGLTVLVDDEPALGPALLGNTPSGASTRITEAVSEHLKDLPGIAAGSFVGSHSFRKTGASALAALRVPWQVIKKWGMWRTSDSAERYVNDDYEASSFLRSFFDWLVDPPTHPEPLTERWGTWAGYGSDDEVDDHFGCPA